MIAGFDKPTTRRRNEYVLRVVRANRLEKSLRRNARRAFACRAARKHEAAQQNPASGRSRAGVKDLIATKREQGNRTGTRERKEQWRNVVRATAPKVQMVSPTENAKGTSPTANVSANFSEAMNPSTINATTVKLKKVGATTSVAAKVTYDVAANRATLPNSSLQRGATYTGTVSTGAKSLANVGLDQNATQAGSQAKTWKFTVRN